MVNGRRRRSDYTAGVLKDGDTNKRHPNSIVAVVRGIISHWYSSDLPRPEREKLTPSSFLRSSSFEKVYFETLDKFRGIRSASGLRNRDTNKATKNIAGMLEGMGATSKQTAVEYYHIRAFADFTGVSDAAFLAFAKTCSLERRSEDRAEFRTALREYVAAEKRFLETILEISEAEDFAGFTFASGQNPVSGNPIWIADAKHLRLAASVFQGDSTQTYKRLMERD